MYWQWFSMFLPRIRSTPGQVCTPSQHSLYSLPLPPPLWWIGARPRQSDGGCSGWWVLGVIEIPGPPNWATVADLKGVTAGWETNASQGFFKVFSKFLKVFKNLKRNYNQLFVDISSFCSYHLRGWMLGGSRRLSKVHPIGMRYFVFLQLSHSKNWSYLEKEMAI